MTLPGRRSLRQFLTELRRRRVVRVAAAYAVIAWLSIQVASDVFPALQMPEWTITLVVVLVLLGFPLALVLAWAYDVTPQGVVRTDPGPRAAGDEAVGDEPAAGDTPGGNVAWTGAAATDRARRISLRIALVGAAVVLALAGGAFVVTRMGGPAPALQPTPGEAAARTVAVLPFHVRGSERLAYLGEGIVDLLSTDLSRSGAVDVIDPNQLLATLATGAERAVDPERARALAEQFGAGLYLLGSVFEVEGRLRLTASLYDRSRGARPIATRVVEGAVADVLPLVSRLAAELARSAPARARGGVRLVWSGDTVDVLGSPSADGRLLSFVDWYTGDLAVRDLDAGTTRRVTNKGEWHESEEFAEFSRTSPDGKHVAYAWFTDDSHYQLRVFELDGSAPRILLAHDATDAWYRPTDWTRDGSAVFVEQWAERTGTLLRVSIPDGIVDTIRALEHGMGPVRLSSNGRWLAYDLTARADPRRQRDIHIMAADGSNDRVVVRNPANDVVLDWVPNSDYLLFWSDRGTAPGIWAVRIADGRAAGEAVLLRSDMHWLDALGFAGGDLLYAITASEQQVHFIGIDWERGEAFEAPAPAVHATAHTTSHGVVSPDGARLAYLSHMPGSAPLTSRVAVRELATGAVTEYPVMLNSPRVEQWLDAGRLLLFGRAAGESRAYYTLELTAGALVPYEATPTARGGDVIRSLVVSPDGRAQYFYRWVGNDAQLIGRDVATGRERVLSRMPALGPIAVSPDGTQVAFTRIERRRDEQELHVAAVTGGASHMVQVSRVVGNRYRSIAWSGDGRYLLYVRGADDGATTELRRVRLEDGDDRLIHRASGINWIRPHPDGRRFAFTAGQTRREVWALERVAELLR